MNMTRILFPIALSMLLSACSLFQIKQDDQGLNTLNEFQVKGKLSVRNAEESVTGYLTWDQDGDAFDLFISGPFGQGTTQLEGDSHRATLALPGKPPVSAASASDLMQAYLGWQFPVLDLRYWVKGQASPEAPFEAQHNEQGLMTQLKQYGWNIDFSRYSQHSGLWLPGRIKITGRDYKFIFVIKRWTLS
jgi:outer membrane lipoprotein LolB